jgi:ribosomal protein S18 acetylase RimI-like enzyme
MKIISPTDEIYLEQMVQSQISLALETEDEVLNSDTVSKGVASVIRNPHKGRYYLALDDNEQFMGMLLTIPEWSDWRCAEVLWIHSVYILPEFRGKKIFKNLYENIKSEVNDNDELAGIRLYVDKTNTTAIDVYKKIGMSDEHYSLFEWLKS